MYQPQKAYIYQSGKHKGKSPDQLMFINPSFVAQQLRLLNQEYTGKKKRNRLHLHYRWLAKRVKQTYPTQICQKCKKKPIQFLSIRHSLSGIAFGPTYCYCEDCIKNYESSDLEIRTITFNFLILFQKRNSKQDFKNMVKLFKWAFDIKRLSKQACFELFKN